MIAFLGLSTQHFLTVQPLVCSLKAIAQHSAVMPLSCYWCLARHPLQEAQLWSHLLAQQRLEERCRAPQLVTTLRRLLLLPSLLRRQSRWPPL